MWELFSQFVVSIFLIVLSGDLLYLFYAGGWHDPNKKIEKAEVISLYFLGGGALVNVIRLVVMLL